MNDVGKTCAPCRPKQIRNEDEIAALDAELKFILKLYVAK